MASPDSKESSPALSQEAAEEMAKYGITRVPVDYFHYEGFRYTNLKDAVAQAKLQHPPSASSPALSQEAAEEMAKYGITRVPVRVFATRT